MSFELKGNWISKTSHIQSSTNWKTILWSYQKKLSNVLKKKRVIDRYRVVVQKYFISHEGPDKTILRIAILSVMSRIFEPFIFGPNQVTDIFIV